jgi:LuxR family maltose regulon positive regulatory protein
VDDALVRLWLSQKDLTTAQKWAAVFEEKVGPGLNEGTLQLDESMEMRLMALARVRLAEGEQDNHSALERAIHICTDLEETTRKSGRIRSLIDLNLLQAVGLQMKTGWGEQRWDPAALSRMETALALGEIGGFLRVFLDGGPLAEGMIRALRSRGSPAQPTRMSQRYLDSILAAFPPGIGAALPAIASNPKLAVSLVEQLTERELEVLRLMASGLSNREMAVKLVLSEGTIKTHVHNLMGKLDAQSRTHALARAKEVGLL